MPPGRCPGPPTYIFFVKEGKGNPLFFPNLFSFPLTTTFATYFIPSSIHHKQAEDKV